MMHGEYNVKLAIIACNKITKILVKDKEEAS
jgi:hypothetical protein